MTHGYRPLMTSQVILLVADGLSLSAVTWLLWILRRLKSGTRRRPFVRQLTMLAFADFIMIIGAVWQDIEWNHIGDDGHVACVVAHNVFSIGRSLSVLTEALMSVSVACSALRLVRAYSFVAALWPVWVVGLAVVVLDAPSPTCKFVEKLANPWVLRALIIFGFSVVTLSYGLLAWGATCSQRIRPAARATLRTLIYPACFASTFGFFLVKDSGKILTPDDTILVLCYTMERLNGFFNVCVYSFGLLYCKLFVRRPINALVAWPRGPWSPASEAAASRRSPNDAVEAAVLAHICFYEGICRPVEAAPLPHACMSSLLASVPSQPPENLPPALGPSINAFALSGCRLVLEPPSLEHLFFQQHCLGRGTFGEVFLASATVTYKAIRGGELYAVKHIRASIMREERQPLRYIWQEREAMMRASVHEGVVGLLEAFVVPRPEMMWVLVMEYCSGGDLQRRIDTSEGAFAADTVRSWAAQTLEALRFLHAQPILHRDLKPGNVLLTGADICKLADFGVATGKPIACSILGTQGYWAPEMILGRPYTAAADIFSWGKVLFCLFVGMPHAAGTVHEVIGGVDGPVSAADLIERATAQEPEGRLDADRLKRHSFFDTVCWDTLYSPAQGGTPQGRDIGAER